MSSNESDCRVRVVCRVRPLNEKEKQNSSFVLKFPSDTTIALGGRYYSYDHVFQPSSSQADVYFTSAMPLVKDVLSGYNATIFAYGQTASGKTHTMEGVLDNEQLKGVIPRIVTDIFNQLYGIEVNVEIHIKVSFFEIYMEKIRDLLDISKVNLSIGETKSRVPYVKGVTERFVTTPEEVLEVVEEGKANRRVSVTNMNAHSSRSHSVFLINVKQEYKETRKTISGKLYLVDLAGSEKVDKTNAQGLTLEEAKTINKSLLALSNVIMALSDGNKPYIPYRDSKLTRVLQESLGGNARTTLVICCSPSSYNEAETKTTLMFGDRAKSIKNKVEINVELTAEEWRRRYDKLKEANTKLRSLIGSYESELSMWRSGKEVSEEEQQKIFLRDFSQDTPPGSSPLDTPTKSGSPDHSDFQEERSKLCSMIEEKDETIQSQSELINQLTLQLQSIEDAHKSSQDECHTLKEQMTEISSELENSQSEVKEVMQALEELAVSYDTKDKEIERSVSSRNQLQEEVVKLQKSVESKSHELHILQDSSISEKRKNHERISTIFRDLNDVGTILGTKLEEKLHLLDTSVELTDEEFTKARIHLSNMRCEVRTLAKQREVLEEAEREARERAHCAMMELGSCKSKMSQYEARNDSLLSNLRELEQRKLEMEGKLTELRSQLEDLRERESTLVLSAKRGSGQRGEAVKEETVAGELREMEAEYMTEIQKLQTEITDKEVEMASMNKLHQNQQIAVDTLTHELEEVRQKYAEEKQLFLKTRLQTKVKERLQQDLGGLTDTVTREMEHLNELREQYIHHMASHLKNKSLEDGSLLEVRPQKEFNFLERNLEELDRAHKKAISENAEMSREIPRLRSILASKSKRIGQLEHMIGETKEVANSEYEKLKSELEQTKQNFMAKLREKERESQYGSVSQRYKESITYTDQLTGLSHTHHLQTTTDPLTGLTQPSPQRTSHIVDQVTGLSMPKSRAFKRHGGPTFVRPVTRRHSTDMFATSRERLIAGAGVALIGQRPKPSQLSTMNEMQGYSSVDVRRSPSPSKFGFLLLAVLALMCGIVYATL